MKTFQVEAIHPDRGSFFEGNILADVLAKAKEYVLAIQNIRPEHFRFLVTRNDDKDYFRWWHLTLDSVNNQYVFDVNKPDVMGV